MKLTVITPVIRKNNLYAIAPTILNKVDWLCVFDDAVPANLPNNCNGIAIPTVKSNWGVAKVNAALRVVKDGFIYVLDDDTILHKNFWMIVYMRSKFDFIHFNQTFRNGTKRTGGIVKKGEIDIGNFVVSRELIGDTYLKEDDSMPDGIWAEELFAKSKNSLYLNETFSIYNYLR
ncbi:MAG: hypothetical protein M0R03_23070 [Novosphingobium sp.]|nr:hypothetical protein [Novosphingobium sp.]